MNIETISLKTSYKRFHSKIKNYMKNKNDLKKDLQSFYKIIPLAPINMF